MLFRVFSTGTVLRAALILLLAVPSGYPETPLMETISATCSTPEQIALFLKENFRFAEDRQLFQQEDYWQSPEEFLEQGAGDCEDYALLAREILQRQGTEAFLFSLYGQGGYAHTVCVFRDGDGYSVINQERVTRYAGATLRELAGTLCRNWTWGAVAEKEGTRGRPLSRIVNRLKS